MESSNSLWKKYGVYLEFSEVSYLMEDIFDDYIECFDQGDLCEWEFDLPSIELSGKKQEDIEEEYNGDEITLSIC